jgi:hypothetical protein
VSIRSIQLPSASSNPLYSKVRVTSAADQGATIRLRNAPTLLSNGQEQSPFTALRRRWCRPRCAGILGRGFLALLPLLALAACGTPPAPVVVYGDSLTVQSESAARFFYPSLNVAWRALGGTAMCDWVAQAANDAAVLHPARVVLAFTGNTATCVSNAYHSGGDVAATTIYEQSLRRMRAIYPHAGISILIPPAMVKSVWFPFNGSPMLVAMYKRVGTELRMTIDTAADDGLTPGHVFTWYRPQFPRGPLVLVRSPEGVHLTPAGAAWYGVGLLKS